LEEGRQRDEVEATELRTWQGNGFLAGRAIPGVVNMVHELETPIGFADSEFEGYTRSGANVVVEVRAWNERIVIVSFRDVLVLRDCLAGSFSRAVRDFPGSTNTLNEALARNFDSVPSSHPYRVYSFLDLDGDPSLEIVAASCEITVR
jgi:uncharacterized protein with LGFP repeats